ncbi:hypothetical protein F4561_005605 [Lipingzhangella halophila]|uniref:Uncharacterized protein n=1 Tax=Lipingzhangella halophila TaxID=1783352 RepID=A0A7W7RC00_9ACTN|nr:hypothetical protein [Lipingzhangella halophila]MBB4934711.1 hypothetical protein [Lipingzhangella halophila]
MTCRAVSFYVLPRRHRRGRGPHGLATCRCGWHLATQSAAGAQDAAALHEAGVRLVVRRRGLVARWGEAA